MLISLSSSGTVGFPPHQEGGYTCRPNPYPYPAGRKLKGRTPKRCTLKGRKIKGLPPIRCTLRGRMLKGRHTLEGQVHLLIVP